MNAFIPPPPPHLFLSYIHTSTLTHYLLLLFVCLSFALTVCPHERSLCVYIDLWIFIYIIIVIIVIIIIIVMAIHDFI